VPARDAFVRDRDTDGDGIYDEPGAVKTVRVSVADDGSQANDRSEDPDISPDGRWVVFWTEATNIFGGDGNGELQDIVLHDRDVDGDGIFDEPGAFGNTLISVSTAGVQANSNSKRCVVSADGRFVAFRSDATNLVSPDTNSPFEDVFLRDVTGAAWADLGHALAGLNGDPQLSGTGTLAGGSAGTLDLGNARPNTLAFLFVGFVNGVAPFKQGILVRAVGAARAEPAHGSERIAEPPVPDAHGPAVGLHLLHAVCDPGCGRRGWRRALERRLGNDAVGTSEGSPSPPRS
jgi:hypothetical protein